MAKWKISNEEFDRQYEEAVKRGLEKAKTEPRAESVSYNRDTNELIIRLNNKAVFMVPCHLLREFDGADPRDIAEVELRPRGTALHWEKLDQDMTVIGLIASVFGNEALMAEMGRKGGSVSSVAKAAAARENGRKGGRPATRAEVRQAREAQHGLMEAQLVTPPEPEVLVSAQVVPSGLHLSTVELVKYHGQIASAEALAVGVASRKSAVEAQLVKHPEPTMLGGAFLLTQEDVAPLFHRPPKDIQAAANSNELALAA
jgi:hypothetical protein